MIDDKSVIRKKWLEEFSKDIKELLNQKKNVIVVSSGAIALGCKKLNINKKSLKLDKSQAIASIGQIELMNLFKKTFNKNKINLSQMLLTLEDTERRGRAINAKRTFDNLFKLGYVPIVNENDSTATTEIKYGDNDRLASRVAQISSADCLILLSDVANIEFGPVSEKTLFKAQTRDQINLKTVGIGIYAKSGASTVELSKNIKKKSLRLKSLCLKN